MWPNLHNGKNQHASKWSLFSPLSRVLPEFNEKPHRVEVIHSSQFDITHNSKSIASQFNHEASHIHCNAQHLDATSSFIAARKWCQRDQGEGADGHEGKLDQLYGLLAAIPH
jgi:hypothetical protein